ncbi:MAG: sensor histidine kinase [Candidatus Heimdallarchaeota archaeon]
MAMIMIKGYVFFQKYKEIVIGTLIGAVVAIADFFVDYYVFERNRTSWEDYIADHLDITANLFEHFFFLLLGFVFGYLWWRTGSQYRAHVVLHKRLEDEQWLSELLLDVMTHDIANYNHIALGNLDLAQDLGEETDEMSVFFTGIRRAVIHSNQLTENVKLLNQLHAKQLERESIFLKSIIEPAVEEVRSVYPRILLSLEMHAEEWEVSMQSHPILKHVFVNLVTNAIKYRKQDKKRVIIELEIQKDAEGILIAVSDHGIGIADELKETVFNRFEKSQKRSTGSGLGLSISRRIVESLQGRIWAENRSDSPDDHSAGTTFKMLFPIS